MSLKNRLTPKQNQIYDYILAFTQERGYPPSVREIAEAVHLKSPSTVHFHLKAMEAAGVIHRGAGKTRSITPVTPAHTQSAQKIPILKEVTAELSDFTGETLLFDTGDAPQFHFAVRMERDTLRSAGILPGDLVVVRQQEPQKPGELMLFLLEGQTACGTASWEQEHLWLTIPDRAPVDGTEVVLLGKITAVVRYYD